MIGRYNIFCFLQILVISFNAHSQNRSSEKLNYDNVFADIPFNDPAANSVLKDSENALERIRNNIFIESHISKTRCYDGEPLLLTYKLYSSLQSTSKIARLPHFADFIVYPMEQSNEDVRYKTVNGKVFRFFDMLQLQVNPIREGSLTIAPISVHNKITYVDASGVSREYTGAVESRKINLKVDALPAHNKPADFTGAIGTFSIHTALRSHKLEAGKSNTLVIEVYGNGNFNSIKLPEILWPDGFNIEPVAERQEVDYAVFPATGKKIFEVPFTSREPGTFAIPPIHFNFFNPSKKTYEQTSSISLPLKIIPADDIVKQDRGVSTKPVFQFEYAFVLLLMVIPVTLIYIIRQKKKEDARIARIEEESSKPNGNGSLELQAQIKMEGLRQIQNPMEYVVAFKSMMRDYLAKKFDSSSLSEQGIVQQLESAYPGVAKPVGSIFEICNDFLYAKGSFTIQLKHSIEAYMMQVLEQGEKHSHSDKSKPDCERTK